MKEQLYLWLTDIGIPFWLIGLIILFFIILGWLARKLLSPTLDVLAGKLLNYLSLLINIKNTAGKIYLELKDLIQTDHIANRHNRFNTQKTYLQNSQIILLLSSHGTLMRRAVKNIWIELSQIGSYSESDIFFAGMELFFKELGKKDIQKIFNKFKNNNQAALWPFLELIETEKPNILFIEAKNYLNLKKEKRKQDDANQEPRIEESLRVPPPGISSKWNKMKVLKFLLSFFPALGLTVFLYWPIYQNVPLDDLTSNLDQEVRALDLPLEKDIKEILNRSIQLPQNRHELCLKNENGFYFIHTDSNSPGIPFNFFTNDLNQDNFGKTHKLGAMGITFYYQDNSKENMNYREFGWPKKCIVLETSKLKNYFASSTIEYSYMGLNRLEEFDLGEQGKLRIGRPIARGYFIDTSKSSVYIIARWKFFILTFIALFGIIFGVIKLLTKKSSKIII